MTSDFEATTRQAVERGDIVGGAAIAVDKNGTTLFSSAFGKISLEPNAEPFRLDTTMWIASCTKVSTAISVLQCVERGLLDLDAPLGDVLPEWKEPEVITGFTDDGEPIVRPARNRLTLRRMLTHSSGMAYSGMHPFVTRYRQAKGQVSTGETIADECFYPLVFEPGEGWEYGVGLDYSGRAVEKVTGMRLSEYMAKNIWAPLGMTSTTFRPLEDQSVRLRMVGRVFRNSKGKLQNFEREMYLPTSRQDDFGGGGLYSSTEDYIKVIISLLKNDGKLLGKEMCEELFRPQLEDTKYLNDCVHHAWFAATVAPGYPRDESTRWDYALGGACVAKEIQGQAAEGTVFWSGLPNSYWFVDRKNGCAGFYGSWLLPPGDLHTGKMFNALQRAAVIEASRKSKL